MTITVDRPVVVAAGTPTSCPAGVPWCAEHIADTDVCSHLGTDRVGRIDRDTLTGTSVDEPIAVTVARHDIEGATGEAIVCLTGRASGMSLLFGGEGFTPAAARNLGLFLLAAAGEASGFKRADDLRIGDRIVVDGRVHEVVLLMIDACYHDVDVRCCEGTVQIHTDLSEAVDDSNPAVTYDAGELVRMEVAS